GAMTIHDHLLDKLCNSIAIGSEIKPHVVAGVEGMVKYTIDWTAIDWCSEHTSTNRTFTHTQEVIAVIDPSCDAVTQSATGESYDAKRIENPQIGRKDFTLYQNYPNPYEGYTVIGFDLPKRTNVRLTIYDVTGKVLRVITGEYNQGHNEIKLTESDLETTGVLYYQMDTDKDSATKKMVVAP